MNKLFGVVKGTWLFLGSILVVLIFVEGGLFLSFSIKDAITKPRTLTEKADTYLDRSWLKDFDKESMATTLQWVPYVYWRRAEFRGNHINVNKQGLRTNQVVRSTTSAPYKIFMFGGSTLWGTGVRDAHTIPALIETRLNEKGIEVQVTNFGESGYVNTQEVMTLLLELRKENIPDLVVFYDGVNDTYSSYQNGLAGIPQNEINRRLEFNLLNPSESSKLLVLGATAIIKELYIFRFVNALQRKLGISKKDSLDMSEANQDKLATSTLHVYRKNIDFVSRLGDHFKFKTLFYWQPTLFQKKSLSAFEKEQRDKWYYLSDFFLKVYGDVNQQDVKVKQFRNLSDVLSDVSEPLFIDWCHLGEKGNRIIAREIEKDLAPFLNRKLK